MRLEGSCHCGAVRFSVNSQTPVPFMQCYCAVCRKTQGGGGFTINLAGDAETLDVTGRPHMSVYRARADLVDGGAEDDGLSPMRRHFCKKCGSALYAWDPRWPELVHPFASAIDSALPKAPETVHIMLDSAPSWVEVPKGKRHTHFDGYPEESIEDWHKTRNLWRE